MEKEFLEKYGRLDWDCQNKSIEECAKEGQRYKGCHVLMNFHSGLILDCDVIEVSDKGFLVKARSISGFADDDDEMEQLMDSLSEPLPFNKFYHVFLAP